MTYHACKASFKKKNQIHQKWRHEFLHPCHPTSNNQTRINTLFKNHFCPLIKYKLHAIAHFLTPPLTPSPKFKPRLPLPTTQICDVTYGRCHALCVILSYLSAGFFVWCLFHPAATQILYCSMTLFIN